MSANGARRVRLFRNGRNQAVRIPVGFELPGGEAIMHREGDRLIIEPAPRQSLAAVLDTLETLDEMFPVFKPTSQNPGRVIQIPMVIKMHAILKLTTFTLVTRADFQELTLVLSN